METMSAWWSKRTLRLLVLAEVALGVLFVAVSLLSERTLPAPLRAYLETQEAADPTPGDLLAFALAAPALAVWLVSLLGLLAFWRPARPLYLASTVAVIVVTPLFGPEVASGWAKAFDSAALILNGWILALLYASPLRAQFEAAVPPPPGEVTWP